MVIWNKSESKQTWIIANTNWNEIRDISNLSLMQSVFRQFLITDIIFPKIYVIHTLHTWIKSISVLNRTEVDERIERNTTRIIWKGLYQAVLFY